MKCACRMAVAGLTLALAGAAGAQESLDQGKTPAQLFASDCAICHKSPQGLAKGGGLFGVQGFLREHYTASRESAAAIAAYLDQVDRAAGPAPKRAAKKPAAKPAAKKPDAAKSDTKTDAKPDAAKPDATKTGDAKATDAKAAEPKAAPKPAETGATPPKPDAGAKPDEKKSN